MTYRILKSKQQWRSYADFLTAKIAQAPHEPITHEPEHYPALAVAAITARNGCYTVDTLFLYPKDLNELR